jgi:thiosulfate dehydrogenase [quinone] large subunit
MLDFQREETVDKKNLRLNPEGGAAFLLRLALGTLFFAAGMGKLFAPGGPSAMSSMLQQGFAETWLPRFVTTPCLLVLPFIEAPLGIILILGIGTQYFLMLTGLLLIALSFGTMVQMDARTTAANMGYVLMAALAFWLSGRDNPYSVDGLIRWRRSRGMRGNIR